MGIPLSSSLTRDRIRSVHKSLRTELLAEGSPTTLEEAQGAPDRWVEHYNALRPHQALGMATPAERFRVGTSIPTHPQQAQPPVDELPPPVERLRLVSDRGVISFATGHYNVGRAYAGEMVTVRAEADLVRVFLDGKLIKVYARKHPAEKEEVIYRHHTRRNPMRGVSTISRS